MKIALITDTHWGIRNDQPAFLENNKKFLNNIYFPYLAKNGIKTQIHLGDLGDRRKYINYYTLHRLRVDYLERCEQMGIDSLFTAGNHDTLYKNTNEFNMLRELVAGRYPFKIVDQYAEEVTYNGLPILIVPWICDDNRKQIMEKIRSTNAKICMGHFELMGFEMFKGSPVSHGDDPNILDRFDLSASGHYHHRSSSGDIYYLGSHAEFTWSDYNDPRGFHVFDTTTKELTFIENPYRMFKKVWYDDSDKKFDIENIQYDDFKDCYVRVIITKNKNHNTFERFVENIDSVGPLDLEIVEDHMNIVDEEDSDIVNEAESTIDIFKNQVEARVADHLKEPVKNVLVDIYHEALREGQ